MSSRGKPAPIIWRSLPLFTAILIAVGCASSRGLSRDALVDVLRQDESRFVGAPAANGTPTRPNAPALGLYLKPTGHLHREFEWTSQDRDALLTWSRQLPLDAGGRSTGFLTLSSLKGHSLTELRGTAGRYGVDWILIVDGAAAVDRYNNYKAGLLYWTIVGAYLADGTHSDALCVVKATLWDVKTGAALFDEEAEAQTKSVGAAALVDDEREIARARTTAMNLLMEKLTKRFAMLAKPGR